MRTLGTLGLVFGVVLIWASASEAACTGSSPTWTSTPDRASVALCVSSASSGDTINVTAGSDTWASSITISGKDLTIAGAGAGSTIITNKAFKLLNSGSDISSFTFQGLDNNALLIEGSQNFRIHGNTMNCDNWKDILTIGSLSVGESATPSYGLFDNNTFTNCRLVSWGEYSDSDGHQRWSESLVLGDDKSVYFEDNTLEMTSCPFGNVGVLCNGFDHNLAGRYVARFNTITNHYFEAHGPQGDRGGRLVEIYNNTMEVNGTFATGFHRPFFIRGGSALIFHNTLNQVWSVPKISIDYVRDVSANPAFGGKCTGSNAADGNEDATGYLCRDQPGASTDAFKATGSPPWPAQLKEPWVFWRNTDPNGEVKWSYNGSEPLLRDHIKADRDIYQYDGVVAFDGTSGIGEDTIANRPSTCTTGVYFWATDEGEWNSNQAGADGQLYKCTATNTWSLYYIPYPYPHPLRSGDETAPNPPTNLMVQ